MISDTSGRFVILDTNGRFFNLDPRGRFVILDTSSQFLILVIVADLDPESGRFCDFGHQGPVCNL